MKQLKLFSYTQSVYDDKYPDCGSLTFKVVATSASKAIRTMRTLRIVERYAGVSWIRYRLSSWADIGNLEQGKIYIYKASHVEKNIRSYCSPKLIETVSVE